MHHTSVDLQEKVREELITVLNKTLANTIDLYLALKQAHWNVKGATFIGIHKLFDDIAEEVEDQVDVIAERITALGGTAFGTLQAVAATTELTAYPTNIFTAEHHIQQISEHIANISSEARRLINHTGDAGDMATADIYTDLTKLLDKNLWFLQAHLPSGK